MFDVILLNCCGCEVDRAVVDDMNEAKRVIQEWSIDVGDTIEIRDHEESFGGNE